MLCAVSGGTAFTWTVCILSWWCFSIPVFYGAYEGWRRAAASWKTQWKRLEVIFILYKFSSKWKYTVCFSSDILCLWSESVLWFWMILMLSFIFALNYRRNLMDWGKHIYGDSQNLLQEAMNAIRVPTEWKQTERWLRASRGNWKVSVIRTEAFTQEASWALN